MDMLNVERNNSAYKPIMEIGFELGYREDCGFRNKLADLLGGLDFQLFLQPNLALLTFTKGL